MRRQVREARAGWGGGKNNYGGGSPQGLRRPPCAAGRRWPRSGQSWVFARRRPIWAGGLRSGRGVSCSGRSWGYSSRGLGSERLGPLSDGVALVTLLGFVPALGLDAILKRAQLSSGERTAELLASSFAARAGWVWRRRR